MPTAALGLKKYLGGTGRVSKTSDNEHTAAALGHSEVLSVKHPPDHAVPEFDQPPNDDGEVAASVVGTRPSSSGVLVLLFAEDNRCRSAVRASARRQKAGDVLDDQPTGTELSSETMELEPQSAPLSSQASTASSHAEVLAGESSDENIDGW